MKTRGRKHTYSEKLLMKQVAEVFSKKRDGLGAAEAAKLLKVSLPSFYNYAAGTDLPRMEVLRDAQREWGIKWDRIDPSAILRRREVKSAEQLVFSFLDAVQEEDVEVVEIGPRGENVLKVTLNIRFPAKRTER